MRLKNIISILILSLFSSSAFALSGQGLSTYPLRMDDKLIGAEMTGITSDGGGVGMQARYTQKFSQQFTFDGGLGISAGERSSRIFANAEYELYPDYMKQPRIAIRTGFMSASEFDTRRNKLSIAPVVSKGFNLWGKEAFPYVSLPVGLSLEGDSQTYESFVNLSTGIVGNLPFNGYEHLLGTVEASVGIKDSYTQIFMGVSYPFAN